MMISLLPEKKHPFKRYGSILDTRISPVSIFGIRYFEKNYKEILTLIPKNAEILEIGPGSANFTQYLLYKGYRNITVCEIAEDNAQSLDDFFGDRIRVIHRDAINYLETSSDTFDFIYAAQLIEHFAYDDFIRFLEHCYTSLNQGGYVVFETINCANITHGLYLRYCDYTHRMGFTPRSLKQFLMAVGEFSDLKLVEIHPLGFLDLLYCAFGKVKGNTLESSKLSVGAYGNTPVQSFHGFDGFKAGRLMELSLKSMSVGFSRWLSFFFLRPYEFERIKVYTPFFAVVAKKAQVRSELKCI